MANQQNPVQTRAWNLLQPSFRAVQCRLLWWWGGGGERVYVGQCVARPRLGCHHSVPSVWRDPGPGPLMTASCSHHRQGSQLASWAGEEQGSYRRAALYWSEVTTGPPLQVFSRGRTIAAARWHHTWPSSQDTEAGGHAAITQQWGHRSSDILMRQPIEVTPVPSKQWQCLHLLLLHGFALKGVSKVIVFCFVIEVQCIWVCARVWKVVPQCTSCCVSVSEKY